MKLYALANKFEAKYFQKTAVSAEELRNSIVEHIKQALANASSVTQSSGIMPFVRMLAQDNAALKLTIVRDGTNITVQNMTVSPVEVASKYQALPVQVKKYLERNWELFPSKSYDEAIKYSNFTFNLQYGEEPGIAVIPDK